MVRRLQVYALVVAAIAGNIGWDRVMASLMTHLYLYEKTQSYMVSIPVGFGVYFALRVIRSEWSSDEPLWL